MARNASTLDRFLVDTRTPTYAAQLAPKTRAVYAALYDRHISPELGSLQLRQLNPENIRRWQADRLKDGAGPAAIHKSITLLGNILQRAVEGGHLQANPARAVRKSRVPRRGEVRPLAPATVEAMRSELVDPAPVQVAASNTGKRKRRADDNEVWPESAWQSWRSHQFARALKAAGVANGRPYDLRHSFASLLLHEGRNVIYVARQLGHGARLTLDTYGHVIEELEEAPQIDAGPQSPRLAHPRLRTSCAKPLPDLSSGAGPDCRNPLFAARSG